MAPTAAAIAMLAASGVRRLALAQVGFGAAVSDDASALLGRTSAGAVFTGWGLAGLAVGGTAAVMAGAGSWIGVAMAGGAAAGSPCSGTRSGDSIRATSAGEGSP
jgi:hypothetical protein